MNRKFLAIGLFGLLTLFAVGWFLGNLLTTRQIVQAQQGSLAAPATQPTPYVPTPPTIKGVDAALLKARWGYEFTSAAADVVPNVTKEQALNKAYESNPGTRQATSVVYELGYLKNPAMLELARQGEKVMPQLADSGLVWILVFEGYPSISSGPAGAPRGHSNELNMVINAKTGEYIVSLIYR